MFQKVEDVDWANWDPRIRATLLFVIRDGRILLIHKKTGFGQGKISGPGGKIEPGETPEACAIRETEEELCIKVSGVEYAGELFFQFTDDNSIHGYVFTATAFEGEPTETEEAAPIWSEIDNLPFEHMWEDDHTWFPYMLSGRRFSGRYVFDGDQMLDDVIELD
ncbi:8-oxo-dGTP diphosphatase [Pontiella sp.]|uniref:8-oxo-dGTP diphosphatase n=1 Tax=Pontiella sp. TaxID=2837462 RepID=UPI003562E908